jgi:hypothetical protein
MRALRSPEYRFTTEAQKAPQFRDACRRYGDKRASDPFVPSVPLW